MPATSSSLSVVLRAATDAELPSGQLSTTESITLVQALGAVPDPRHRRGRRHSLQSVLLLALGAVLAGACSYAAVADHAMAMCGRRRMPARSGGCWAAWMPRRWKRR